METKFKIGYFSDGPWGHNAFNLLIKDERIDISFVVPRYDNQDEVLKELCSTYEIDYIIEKDINSVAFRSKALTYNCDLFISMSFNQIFRKELITLPRFNTINCHAGNLPYYRGRNVLNWVLINDEKYFGITVHFMDESIDSGDIIIQRQYEITEDDTYATLLEVAYNQCAALLYDSVKLFIDNAVTVIPQKNIHRLGFYCGRRGVGDEVINWTDSSRNIFNFIRAITYPGPVATTFINGFEVKIIKSRYLESAPCYINIPGQILCKTKKGFLVKTGDSFLEITEYESTVKLKVGDRLTSSC